MTTHEAYQFKAEIKQLLHILVHSLYQDRDIFLRELISNASDALARLQFEMLTNRDVLDPDAELAIHIETVDEEDGKRLIIKDSGIGMTADELVRNLGTIAQSGAREFLAKLSESESSPTDIIGQFGVGFYSLFMVADEVRVVSRSYQPDAEAAQWISDGGDTFRVESAEKSDRGTEIHLTLKRDADEFAQPYKVRQVIKHHSDFVSFPIYVEGEQANQREPLWRKRPTEVEQSEYDDFYKQMSLDFEAPLATVHFVSDAPVQIRALLFIPSKFDRGMLAVRKEAGLKLYANKVMIQEYCKDLLPEWLRFVDGVVESEDLPLNVSRETVQNNRLLRQLATTIRKRLLRELTRMAKKETEKYETFWTQFGRILKEGLAMDMQASDDIQPLLRFESSTSGGQLTSLDTYVERMPEGQDEIYYVLADGVKAAAHSPHLDPFKARDWEVLYFADPIDPFFVASLNEYGGKSFKNIEDADLELPEIEDEAETPDDADALSDKAFNLFVGRCVTTLGDRVTEVRASKRLKDSPVRLVAPENAFNSGMDRVQRYMSETYEVPKRIMEVNRTHPIVQNVAHLVESNDSSPAIGLIIEQLYESALVQEGLHPNPALMLPRIQKLMELATGNGK
jgi:molecular chaperone HtpG